MADYLTEARKIFKEDKFATDATGIIIEAADVNYAKCKLELYPKHMNALNTPMGGAIYTLADFTFAIASNIGNVPTVTMTSEIAFLKVAKGDVLTSESHLIKEEDRDCYFRIDITDSEDIKIAEVNVKGRRKKQRTA